MPDSSVDLEHLASVLVRSRRDEKAFALNRDLFGKTRKAIRNDPERPLGSRVGACTTAFPVYWVVRKAPGTACYLIQSAMIGFTASTFLFRNRVSPKEAFEGLELCERKLSCTVLRGLDGSNPVRLLGDPSGGAQPITETVRKIDGAKAVSRRTRADA
jgi:hypothetical protein